METIDPLADCLRCGVVLAGGGGSGQPAMHHRQNHPLSTFRRQASILVGVHSVLRESLVFGDFSVPGSDRMDNLLTVHS